MSTKLNDIKKARILEIPRTEEDNNFLKLHFMTRETNDQNFSSGITQNMLSIFLYFSSVVNLFLDKMRARMRKVFRFLYMSIYGYKLLAASLVSFFF